MPLYNILFAMKSSFTDFDPPQSTNNGSDRHTTKTYIGSSVDQSQPVEKKLKSKQAQPKNKRPLSVYNIFYRETRKKILEERGYTESSDEDIRSQSPPKKRGRPRGPNYQKKKTPHHLIGLEELTNEVAVRWKASKDEYHAKYDVVVEEKKQKYKAEKKAKEKSELSETSENKDTSVKNNRYEDSYGGREDNISKCESSSDHNLQSSNCTETSMHFIDRPKSARGISQSEKDIFNPCEQKVVAGVGVGCSWVPGEPLGGCSPPPGGNMGCVQPGIGDGWVSPGYHTPLMFLDTDITERLID